MSNIQIFNYNSTEIRTIQNDGEPWFVLKDVCQVLGMDTTQLKKVADRLEADEKGRTQITTPGGVQETWIINESGLYNVILRSDKPEAKPFRKWVTSEVLPTIRRHGMYATPDTVEKMLADPDTTIKLLETIKQERAARLALEAQAEADKPKVLFADAVSASHTSILVGDLAKLLRQNGVEIGQNRLFRFLRDNGYLCSHGERYNLPTQRSMDRGWFQVKETTINQPDGSVRITRTVKVTGKGQQYFINLFLSGAASA
nr:phage antirepressor [uncultured Oscillibacter sp.]